MMGSIRRRAATAMLIVIGLTTLSYGSVAVLVSDRVEATLLNTIVARETAFLADQIRQNQVLRLPQSSQTQAWYKRNGHGHVPQAFDQLPLGMNHDVVFQQDKYHVQKSMVDGGELTVAFEITVLEARERQFQLVMIGGGLVVALLALLGALWLSLRVAAPIERLANELKTVAGDDLNYQFSGRYDGAEVHAIAEALDQYTARIKQMIEREQGFAAAASHEIRSPLTVITGALELLRMDGQIDHPSAGTLARAQRAAKTLGQTMDGLFELARPPSSNKPEPLDVCVLTDELMSEFSSLPDNERLHWQPPNRPISLPVSPSHWRILIRNLIDNALKHAPAGSVEIGLSSRCFTVRDHGPGIDPSIMPHLFERSRRGIESSGAGLGLYIASELAQRYGWSISASNLEDGGSRFSVTFQASDSASGGN